MFGKVHIHQHGTALCHAFGGLYVQFEEAAGMNTEICCGDCRRRYVNLAKMKRLDWNQKGIDKAVLREKINN